MAVQLENDRASTPAEARAAIPEAMPRAGVREQLRGMSFAEQSAALDPERPVQMYADHDMRARAGNSDSVAAGKKAALARHERDQRCVDRAMLRG